MPTASPDLTEFFKYSQPKRPPCKLGVALGQLKPQERAQLEAALACDVSVITATAVERWLEKRKIDVTTAAVTNHRKSKCSCARDE